MRKKTSGTAQAKRKNSDSDSEQSESIVRHPTLPFSIDIITSNKRKKEKLRETTVKLDATSRERDRLKPINEETNVQLKGKFTQKVCYNEPAVLAVQNKLVAKGLTAFKDALNGA